MKNITKLLLVVGLVGVMSGCSISFNTTSDSPKNDSKKSDDKTITCNKSEQESDYGYSTVGTLTATMDGDRVVEFKMNEVMTYEDDDTLESAYGLLKFSAAALNTMNGVNSNLKKDGKDVTLEAVFNLNKMSEEDIKDAFNIENSVVDSKILKEYAENQGYTCK